MIQPDGVSEMTDKELIELAAKAAGLHVKVASNSGRGLKVHGNCNWWNPLTDDGDALRLAVKLGIELEFFSSTVYAGPRKTAKYAVDKEHDLDMAAATRRAIVRAAAQIGKEME